MLRWGVAGALLPALLSQVTPGFAEAPPDVPAAVTTFRQGRDAMRQHDYAAACAIFQESYALQPAIGTLLNLGFCEEKLNKVASAAARLQLFLETAPKDDDRRAHAMALLEALRSRIGHADEPDAPIVNAEAPGPPAVSVGDSPGTGKANADIGLSAAAVAYPPKVAPLPSPVSVSAVSPDLDAPSRRHGDARFWGIAVGGGFGLAGLATGIVSGLLVLSEKDVVDTHCSAEFCDRTGQGAAASGRLLGGVSTVAFVGGALGLGLALSVALWPGSKAPDRTHAPVSLDLAALGGAPSVILRGVAW
jgi:hypothetical protein